MPTFIGINGNFNGYALENSDFNPQSDDSNIDSFFNDDFGQQGGEVIDKRIIKKGRIKRIRKTRKIRESSAIRKSTGSFGGF